MIDECINIEHVRKQTTMNNGFGNQEKIMLINIVISCVIYIFDAFG